MDAVGRAESLETGSSPPLFSLSFVTYAARPERAPFYIYTHRVLLTFTLHRLRALRVYTASRCCTSEKKRRGDLAGLLSDPAANVSARNAAKRGHVHRPA